MITGYSLGENETPCPYINGETFRSENYILEKADCFDIDVLLERGYRHFGNYFFRPVCVSCHRCLPLRVLVHDFHFSRNARRLLKKNGSLKVIIKDHPEPSEEKFELYRKHKKRFSDENSNSGSPSEQYAIFKQSFFTNFPFSKILEVSKNDQLIAVTHLDIGNTSISAIYCYYDTDYLDYSPGRYSIYKGIEYAMNLGKKYYYLGYYIENNSHMSYKGQYKPNEVLSKEGIWRPGPGSKKKGEEEEEEE